MTVRRFDDVVSLKEVLRPIEREGVRIGLVPTMGALHDGHLSLIETARAAGAEHVVASIFVNPLQFGPNEDFDRYPRDLEGDLARLEAAGCEAVFLPSGPSMYPPGFQTVVEVSGVTEGLCGDHRPGHFRGVTTVVLKLFEIVRPAVAVFGEKDFQQLATLRAMARDLNLDVAIVGAPLVREPDGLALSSRNRLLTSEDRLRARAIFRGLEAARTLYEEGEREAEPLVGRARAELSASGLVPEYLELRGFDDLAPLERADRPAVLLTAVRVGRVRLIDNVILSRPEPEPRGS